MSESKETRWERNEMKQRRLSDPSGWVYLTQNDHAQLLVDALIDGYPDSFNKSELADFAGVSRDAVYDHLELLQELSVVEETGHGRRSRYRFDPDSRVSEAIVEVDTAVRIVREDADGC